MKTIQTIAIAVSVCAALLTSNCPCCVYVKKDIDACKPPLKDKDPFITVWIHGVSLICPNKSDIGLRYFSQLSENASLKDVGCMLHRYAPEKFPLDHIYAYSWCGSFNYNECTEAGCELYWSLKDLVEQYQETYGFKPKIRIITFSYGGNIALSLARVKDEEKFDVEELFLLGYPVMKGVSKFASDPMFKRVFNLYAVLDLIQVIDPQGFVAQCPSAPLFTSRCLKSSRNIVQAKTRLNGRSFGHFGFIDTDFLSAIANVFDGLNEIFDDQQQAQQRCDKQTFYLLNIYTKPSLARSHMYRKKCK